MAIVAIVIVVASSLLWLPDAVQRGRAPQAAPPGGVPTQLSGNAAPPSRVDSALAEVPAPAPKATHVEITDGPGLELVRDDLAIIRWTSTNPGGTDDHFAVAFYGTDPAGLNQAAQNHIRLNREHPEATFRVRLSGLKPQTTYYYSVTSTESDGSSDGVQSSVNHFTTP